MSATSSFAKTVRQRDLYIVREGRVAILIDIGRGKQTVIDTDMPQRLVRLVGNGAALHPDRHRQDNKADSGMASSPVWNCGSYAA